MGLQKTLRPRVVLRDIGGSADQRNAFRRKHGVEQAAITSLMLIRRH
jgi:hypothetical protein